MSAGTEQRKLTAIMFTDMVGYSALAQRNEALALELLEEHRRLLRPLFPKHNGREVETAGDAFLVEFASALEAVRCAVEIQESLAERNRVSPPERAIRLRIGVHVGDVVHKDGKVMGDAVNIAARIEPLAPTGGVCVSNAVFEQVRNKLERRFASLGPAELKNIELPVAVHRVVMPWEKETRLPATPRPGKSRWRPVFGAVLLVVVLGGALAVWRPGSKPKTAPEAGADAKSALTEAQKLTQRARALIDDDPLAVRENYRLAEELSQRAVQIDPADADAWATLARASLRLVAGRYDDTAARRESARSQAERAIRLSPDSLEPGLALGEYLLASRQFVEAESRGRKLALQFPKDPRPVLQLAESLDRQDRAAEARALLLQHTNAPTILAALNDSEAYEEFDQNHLVEADAILDRMFAANPTAATYLTRLLVLWRGWGDLGAAAAFVDKIPTQLLQEDAFAHHVASIWMELGQTEKALETLRLIPREFLEEKRVARPKGLLTGRILYAAGRTAAAEMEWRQALNQVEKRLAAEPSRAEWVRLKAQLLAHLNEQAEAQKQLKLWCEMTGTPADDSSIRTLEIRQALGEQEAVIQAFQTVIAGQQGRWLNHLNMLRHDPQFTLIRADPRMVAVIAQGESYLAEMRLSASGPGQGGAALVPEKSVAVLAFANLSEDKANEYFSDGISEELLNVLARVPGLKVSARTSAFSFKGRNLPIPEMAKQLGVAYVVEGSVRKAGDRVRITAQLIKAADGFRVWSATYDRDLKDIFAVQEEIANRVAGELSTTLGVAGVKAPAGGTRDVAAYDAFLKGREAWNMNTPSGDVKAVEFFKQALALDPDYATAHGALAEAYVSLANDGVEPAAKVFPLARASAQRALQLDPGNVLANTALAEYAFHYDWDYDAADHHLAQAVAADPNYGIAYSRMSGHYIARNQLDQALAASRRSRVLDPLGRNGLGRNSDLAGTLLIMKRFPEGIVAAREELNLGQNSRGVLGVCLIATGQHEEGIRVLEELMAKAPDAAESYEYLAWGYGRVGRPDEARKVEERLRQLSETRYVSPLAFARIAAGRGDVDGAFAQLDRAFELRDPMLPSIGNDPLLEPIRTDPRFRALLKRLKLDLYFPAASKN